MNLNFDLSKPVAIGSDHAGYEYKTVIVDLLQHKGLAVKDLAPIIAILLIILISHIRLPMLLKMVMPDLGY